MSMVTREEIIANLISAERAPGGWRPTGSPFIIHLKNRKSLPQIVTLLSGGTSSPFKIFALKSRVEDELYVLYATDLITGCPLEMEVSPKWIAVHLRRVPGDDGGDCQVNTLLRLFENVKAHIDPDAELEPEAGQSLK